MLRKKFPNEINGFEIVQILNIENDIRYGIVICKACNKQFKTSLYHLDILKSCGCARPKAKPLPEYINGFKILKDLGQINRSRRCVAICKECKRQYEVDPNQLKYRKHCGCIRAGSKVSKYAKSHPQLAQCFKHMMARCYNKKNKDYYLYGEKGITVCNEWKLDRNKFCEWAFNNGYKKELTLDRIDNKKGYFPENCRWVDRTTQARNSGRNVLTIELAREIRRDYQIMQDLKLRGLGRPISLATLSKKYNVSQSTVWCVIKNKIWME